MERPILVVIRTGCAGHAGAGFGRPAAQDEAPVAIAAIGKASAIDLQIDQRMPGNAGLIAVAGHAGVIAETDFLRKNLAHGAVLAIAVKLVIRSDREAFAAAALALGVGIAEDETGGEIIFLPIHPAADQIHQATRINE